MERDLSTYYYKEERMLVLALCSNTLIEYDTEKENNNSIRCFLSECRKFHISSNFALGKVKG